MAELTVQAISKVGLADLSGALSSAAAGGDSVRQSSGLLIVVENADASPHTLTVAAPKASADCGNYGDLPISDLTLVVAAADIGAITIPSGYGDGAFFSWTYEAVTSVTVGVFSLAP